ncbi:Retrovirus-related Pol polyprotein from transposon gypsy [Sesamum angolense]|uniref:Retrovirus-related Pol polyprotein from transposon gypsy n=1 Tax=Sesamum angolense TaxID=2727404 RepID=A0AAE2BQL9_9LAMI|nr:Retrovirus-related Pol polyprotein from transposon gypsy [Sesamum angolense]
MAPTDEERTTFHTPKGIYRYKLIPFGLKNADTTYQKAMQRIFDDMLHKNVECYVDDLVVKSKKREDHFHDFFRPCCDREEPLLRSLLVRSVSLSLVGKYICCDIAVVPFQ